MTGRMEHGDLIIIMSSDYGAELYSEGSVITTRSAKTAYNKVQLEEMAEQSGGMIDKRLNRDEGYFFHLLVRWSQLL